MATLGRPEAGPLIEALNDPSAEIRIAVLEALTRLPLDRDCWLDVRRYVAWALEDGTAPEHLQAISPAARVPVSSVRMLLSRLAESGSPDERRLAALALADVGDDRAAEPLLALPDDPEAAKRLARLDLSPHLDAVRQRSASGPPEVQFWLAVGLARAGDDTALLGVLRGLAAGGLELPFLWGDPSLLVAELQRGPALPQVARAHIQEFSSEEQGDAERLAGILLEAGGEAREVPTQAVAAPAPVPLEALEGLRAQVRTLLNKHLGAEITPGWPEAAQAAIAEVATGTDQRAAWALAISDLFRRATETLTPQTLFLGNDIAGLAHDVEGFVPDVDGLFESYLPLVAQNQGDGGIGAQIAWAATRGGLPYLLARLAPKLSDPELRLAAARLLAQAADYASSDGPPIFGGAPAEPEPPVPTEMIDDMAMANGGGGRRTRSLPPERPAAEPPPTAAPPAAEPPPTAAPPATEPPAAGPPPTEAMPTEAAAGEPTVKPEPRWILARVTTVDDPEHPLENGFRAGVPHEVAVAIGPAQTGMLAATGGQAFDEAMGPASGLEQLFVMLIPPPSVSDPLKGSIFLPPTGTSRPCTFALQIPADLESFEAQIQVYHRNRMIQLALLRGPVLAEGAEASSGSRIELELAVITPGTADLGSREKFDVALARTTAGTTGVADDRIALFDNERINRVIPTLTGILTKIVTSEAARRGELEDPGVVDDLRALAFQGRELHHAIAEPLAKELGDPVLGRLQVLVENACDFFPVELVYELPTPTLTAGLCPGWKVALQTGSCPEPHEAKGPRGLAEHVCPIGFWSLSKVIERQVVGDESWSTMGFEGHEFAVRSHPSVDRGSLGLPWRVLFAASGKVDEVRKGQIAGVQKALRRIDEDAVYTETWTGWVEAVETRDPSLLVLLSHTADEQFQAALEVGAGDRCLISQIAGPYLRTSTERSPIVLLLGCETAVSDFGLQTFVAKFQDLGAALVVGTVASVLGQRAAPVAKAIAADFAAAARKPEPTPAGDLLLAIRRKLLAKGELTSLCLTAFGDANWQLGGS